MVMRGSCLLDEKGLLNTKASVLVRAIRTVYYIPTPEHLILINWITVMFIYDGLGITFIIHKCLDTVKTDRCL